MRVAVVGSGISGLGAAWALSKGHEVVVFEADDRIGGHSNTVDVNLSGEQVAVDTGFIVYNEPTYPHLTRLFDQLGVATEPSDMSFAYSRDDGFEYAASGRGLLAQPSNLVSRRYRSMIVDILRFARVGEALQPQGDESLAELLERNGFGPGLIEDYLYPMTAAIWSAPRNGIVRQVPASVVLRFLSNHGLIDFRRKPSWRTVTGGSRQYVARIQDALGPRIRIATPVHRIERFDDRVELFAGSTPEVFDQVVFACHSDQALSVLGAEATWSEAQALGAIPYRSNRVVLHGDSRLMPKRRSVWSSWSFMARSVDDEKTVASVTYWMNRLQNLSSDQAVLVSLNPVVEPSAELVHAEFEYSHPQFDRAAVEAQRRIAAIQGANRTWFAGAYCGYGFHEDGLQSGLNVAAALGSPPPWWGQVDSMSSALPALVGVPL